MVGFYPLLAQCSNVVIPEITEQAMSYYRSGNILWVVAQILGVMIPGLFLIKKGTTALEKFSWLYGRYWFFSIVIYLFCFMTLSQILQLPFDFYVDYIREHIYGLSHQTFKKWILDYGKTYGISLIAAFSMVWVFYFLLKKSPRRWWFYGAIVSIGFTFFMMFIQPIWIDPLFNSFTPMKNKVLEEKILQLAARAGIEHGKVFEVNKSQETTVVNAYVTGFGGSSRIVLWDTTLEQMTPDEILFVMGHEMGHYVLHHVWWYLLYFSVISFIVFYFIYKVGSFIVFRYGKQLGFFRLDQIASFPLFLILINIACFFITPVFNRISCHIEHEADRFGLEITQNNEAAARAFIVLQQKNLANPRPGLFYKIWRGDHPDLGDRIDFCNTYCPWKAHMPLKYEKYFKST